MNRSMSLIAGVVRSAPPVRGKGRLALYLMRRAEAAGRRDGLWRGKLRDGTELELPCRSLQTWRVAFEGDYDQVLVQHLLPFVESGTILLDVGASLGLWTVQLGQIAARRDAQVWAFEPNPANIPWIERNVRLNGLDDVVTIRDVGLSDAAGELTLGPAEGGVGNAVVALRDNQGSEKFPRIPISVVRLDDVELPTRVGLVKVDVEGYEAAFLRGAMNTIRRDRPVIFGEFSPRWLKRRGENLRPILAALDYDICALKAVKHRLRATQSVRRTRVDLDSHTRLPGDLLLVPR
jgi:FkbM family methyltransferase